MKKDYKILTTICGFCLIIGLLIQCIDIICFNRAFFEYEYKKGNQAELINMSEEDLMKATNALLDYLKDDRDDIVVEATVNGNVREVFDERETLHMVDVKNLYQGAKLAESILFSIGIFLAIIICIINKEEYFSVLFKAFKRGLILVVVFVAMIGIYALIDFNSFWLQFHYVFFDNDLFILDPNVSIMINMFPENFFFEMVLGIIGLFGVSLLIIYLILKYIYGVRNA